MTDPMRIAICGHSIALAAVESFLQQSSDFELRHYSEAELQANLLTLEADVMLLEQNAYTFEAKTILEKYRPSLPVISLDFTDSHIVSHLSRTDTLVSPDDLGQIIQVAGKISCQTGTQQLKRVGS